MEQIPVIKNPKKEFSSWRGFFVSRPLVAASSSHFKDPEGWKRIKVSQFTFLKSFKTVFLKTFQGAVDCYVHDVDGNSMIPWKIKESNIQISEAFQSTDGRYFIEAQTGSHDCVLHDDPESSVNGQWFYMESAHSFQHLRGDMSLVDTGDYDSNEFSEVIFQVHAYNYDGYVLYTKRFKEKAEMGWEYH